MMKKISIIFLSLVVSAGAALAQDAQAPAAQAPADPQQELTSALQELSASQIGALTVADVAKVVARMSLARQRIAYVQRASMSSLFFPGAGQFMTGNTLAGALFLTGDLAVITGTVLGAYFLLPSQLQFGSINYLTDSIGTIKTAWEGRSIGDYLPAAGVMAGGMLLKAVLGHVSARLAAREARENIAEGKVTFTPTMDMMGQGRFMMGMRMRM
jgi:TM2 domain-containing membrane protein YozV